MVSDEEVKSLKKVKITIMATALGLLLMGQSAFAASEYNGMLNMMHSSNGEGMAKMMEHMSPTAKQQMMEQHKRFME
jgi:hypothetical protein